MSTFFINKLTTPDLYKGEVKRMTVSSQAMHDEGQNELAIGHPETQVT